MSDGHLGQEALVWHYYGEEAGVGESARHLEACGRCRTELERLKATLIAVEAWPVPERNAGYGERVWQKLARREPALAGRSGWWRRWTAPSRLVLAGALGAAVAGAVVAGRPERQRGPAVETAPSDTMAGERILAAALGEHLAQSERILLEILNRQGSGAEPASLSGPAPGSLSVSGSLSVLGEQERASGLLDDNRLYRYTAARLGHPSLAGVLEDLERVLLEVARGPHDLSAEQLASLRQRMGDQELVFKVRVLQARLRGLGNRPMAAAGGHSRRG
jgi:hypothetical protein